MSGAILNRSAVVAVDGNAVTSSISSSKLEKHSRTNPLIKFFLVIFLMCICQIIYIYFVQKQQVDGRTKASDGVFDRPELDNHFNPFTTGDYKLYVRTPQNVTLDDLARCFQQRHNGSTIFQDNGIKFLPHYMPEVLADVYLWRTSRHWGGLTSRLEDAHAVLLLSFSVISKHTGECKGTTHEDRQSSVINWARRKLTNTTPAAFVCPSWSLCYGEKTFRTLKGKNIKVLMGERNPKWLMNKWNDKPTQILNELVKNTTRTHIIPYPANRNIERFHPRLLEIPDDAQYNNSNENIRTSTSRTTPARSKTGVLFIGSKRRTKVRSAMSKIANRKDTEIVFTDLARKSVKSYAQQMMAAQFCLCPSGDSPTARRLYDAIVAGCLPIVISDDIIQHVPFPQTIDYESFWFRIKSSKWIRNPGAELDRVVSTPVEDLARRQIQMASYVSALDWTDANNNDGLRLILDEIIINLDRDTRNLKG